MVGDRRHDLEAISFVEPGGLERERHQQHLAAPPATGFALGGLKQQRAEPLMPMRLLDPELAYLAAASPRIAANAGDDATRLIP